MHVALDPARGKKDKACNDMAENRELSLNVLVPKTKSLYRKSITKQSEIYNDRLILILC